METYNIEDDKKDDQPVVRKARSKLARLLGICEGCGEKSFNCTCNNDN